MKNSGILTIFIQSSGFLFFSQAPWEIVMLREEILNIVKTSQKSGQKFWFSKNIEISLDP